MTARPTHTQFQTVLNQTFTTDIESGVAVELKLTEVSELKQSSPFESFALLFQSPKEAFLNQGTYCLANKQMGTYNIFLVPVGEDENSYKYEAIFNYKIDYRFSDN